MNDERLFAVNLLWVHDPDMFAEYQEAIKASFGEAWCAHRVMAHDRDDGRERV